jgi:hypothetical protein
VNTTDLNRDEDGNPPQSLYALIDSAISKWPDLSFTTPGGRRFCLAEFSDSILHRILADGNPHLTTKQRDLLSKLVGVITDSDGDPMLFGASKSLERAWFDLHEASGVRLSHDDCQWFSR